MTIADDTQGRLIGFANDYDGVVSLFRERATELGLTMAFIDEIAGFQTGYAGKLLGPAQVKALGRMSLGVMLEVLGLKIAVVEDADTLARMRERYVESDRKSMRSCAQARIGKMTMARVFVPVVTEYRRRGGLARAAKLTAEARAKIAKKANRARNKGLSRQRRSYLAMIAAKARWANTPPKKRFRKVKKAEAPAIEPPIKELVPT